MTAPTEPTLWELLREDWETHGRGWTLPGFHAIAVHRLGMWARGRRDAKGRLAWIAYKALNNLLIRNVYGVEIFESTTIGRRVKIGHHMGVILGAWSEIGDDVLVCGGVTIGKGGEQDEGRPRIGNGVELGAGALVLGSVTIGDGARIGPHAVVVTNVPPGSSVMAPPAKVLKPRPLQPVEDAAG